jgi:hypothetical protein
VAETLFPRWQLHHIPLTPERPAIGAADQPDAGVVGGQRRYAKLQLAGLHDIDYRTKTFSCARCGAPAYLCVVNPSSERGMEDYRLDELERPTHHPNAVRRLSAADRPSINFSGRGEQPGRKVDPRR